jgi:hypothetical protein
MFASGLFVAADQARVAVIVATPDMFATMVLCLRYRLFTFISYVTAKNQLHMHIFH